MIMTTQQTQPGRAPSPTAPPAVHSAIVPSSAPLWPVGAGKLSDPTAHLGPPGSASGCGARRSAVEWWGLA
jgi:hypothetical protein